jgi:hypothetical protein
VPEHADGAEPGVPDEQLPDEQLRDGSPDATDPAMARLRATVAGDGGGIRFSVIVS